jgi:hypothetical protein
VVAILVAMFWGGVSGSGPANAAAVGGVMIAAMARAGYPAPFSASVIGSAAATDILIPPSIALIIYSVMVPGASVPAHRFCRRWPGGGGREIAAGIDRLDAAALDALAADFIAQLCLAPLLSLLFSKCRFGVVCALK